MVQPHAEDKLPLTDGVKSDAGEAPSNGGHGHGDDAASGPDWKGNICQCCGAAQQTRWAPRVSFAVCFFSCSCRFALRGAHLGPF